MKPTDRQIILIAHNLRSCHNVGSLLRTAEGLGIQEVILSGYTPYPFALPSTDGLRRTSNSDHRLPHEAAKIARQINKTALGAETMIAWRHEPDVFAAIESLRADGWQIAALEQTETSRQLHEFKPTHKTVVLLGREVEGVEPEVLSACDVSLEIPMFGRKESFNVVQAAAMAMYQCRFS